MHEVKYGDKTIYLLSNDEVIARLERDLERPNDFEPFVYDQLLKRHTALKIRAKILSLKKQKEEIDDAFGIIADVVSLIERRVVTRLFHKTHLPEVVTSNFWRCAEDLEKLRDQMLDAMNAKITEIHEANIEFNKIDEATNE